VEKKSRGKGGKSGLKEAMSTKQEKERGIKLTIEKPSSLIQKVGGKIWVGWRGTLNGGTPRDDSSHGRPCSAKTKRKSGQGPCKKGMKNN